MRRLRADDRTYRQLAHAFFEKRRAFVEHSRDARLQEAFAEFESHWSDYFAPRDARRRAEYLATPPHVRRRQFSRFTRACQAWEKTFRGLDPGTSLRAGSHQAPPPRDALRRKLLRHKARHEELQAFHEELEALLESEDARRSLPIELLTHLRELGVSPDASLDEIRAAYRRLAKEHHPDISGDETTMQRLNLAFGAVVEHHRSEVAQG